MENVVVDALADRITEFSAHLHAATAELAIMAAEFDTAGGWTGVGVRGCAHWLSIETGMGTAHAGELVRVGHAVADLPLIREAFLAGRLSFDKVRMITQVATPEDEHIWLELALQASGGQLLRICNAYRDTVLADDPQRSRQQQARRRVVTAASSVGGVVCPSNSPLSSGCAKHHTRRAGRSTEPPPLPATAAARSISTTRRRSSPTPPSGRAPVGGADNGPRGSPVPAVNAPPGDGTARPQAARTPPG